VKGLEKTRHWARGLVLAHRISHLDETPLLSLHESSGCDRDRITQVCLNNRTFRDRTAYLPVGIWPANMYDNFDMPTPHNGAWLCACGLDFHPFAFIRFRVCFIWYITRNWRTLGKGKNSIQQTPSYNYMNVRCNFPFNNVTVINTLNI
jgi:hypothetical protein